MNKPAKRRPARVGNDARQTIRSYRILFEQMRQGALLQAPDGSLLDVNPAALELLGLTRQQLRSQPSGDIRWNVIRADGSTCPSEALPSTIALRTGQPVRDVTLGVFNPRLKGYVWLEVTAIPEFRHRAKTPFRVLITFHDISERRRTERRLQVERQRTELLLELHQKAPQMTDRELYDYVLDKAVRLTESEIGFFHQVSDDQNTIILTTWNEQALRNCTAAFQTHYPLREAGNWVECVRQQQPVVYNNFAQSPHQKGLPPGHAPLQRFMSIPVLEDGKVRIIFGVGNKRSDYETKEVNELQLVANELHKIMVQRTTEAALRQSEEFKEAVFNSFTSSIAVLDPEGSIVAVNQAWRHFAAANSQVSGQSPAGTGVGANYLAACLGACDGGCASGAQAYFGIKSVLEGSLKSFTMDYPCHAPDQQRWFTVTVTPLGDGGRGVVVVHTNITDLKLAQAALVEREERLQLALEGAELGLWDLNLFTGKAIVAGRFEEILGYRPGEVEFNLELWQESLHPDDRKAALAAMRAHLEGQTQVYQSEYRLRTKGGNEVWVQARGRVTERDELNRVRRVVGIILDITQRKWIETLFRAQRDLALALAAASSLPDGLQRCLEAAIQVSAMDAGGFYLLDDTTGGLNLMVHRGLSDAFVRATSRYEAGSDQHSLVVAGKPVYSNLEALSGAVVKPVSREGLKFLAVVPLADEGRVIGCLNVASKRTTQLPPEGRHILEAIAAGASQALKRLKAEEQLRKLSEAVEQSPVCIMITDLEGRIDYVNRRFCELTGYLAQEVLGQNPRFLKSGHTSAETYRQMWQTITQGGKWAGEMQNRKKNGELFWEYALIAPITDTAGRATHFLGVKEDITERKRMEWALRESEQRYRQLVDNSPLPIMAHQEGRFVFLNEATAKLFGAESVEALIGTRLLDRVHPDYRNTATRRAQDIEAAGAPAPLLEEKLLRLDGTTIDAEVSVTGFTHQGRPAVQVVLRDITDRKRAEEQLRALALALTRAEHQERRRIARLLHDEVIQSLALTRIRLGALRAQMAGSDKLSLVDDLQHHVEQAIASLRSMTFQLSPPVLHELGLEAALGWLVDQFTQDHGLLCELITSAPLAPLQEEARNLVFSAVRELLVNVVKHAQATRVTITTETQDDHLRLTVEDNGKGFDPSRQGFDIARTGGFGLFSVRERLSYLGGHCVVHSVLGKGTRAELRFPILPAQAIDP